MPASCSRLGFEGWSNASEPLDDEALQSLIEQVGDEYPNVAAMVKGISHDADTTLGFCDDQFEFEFGSRPHLGRLGACAREHVTERFKAHRGGGVPFRPGVASSRKPRPDQMSGPKVNQEGQLCGSAAA